MVALISFSAPFDFTASLGVSDCFSAASDFFSAASDFFSAASDFLSDASLYRNTGIPSIATLPGGQKTHRRKQKLLKTLIQKTAANVRAQKAVKREFVILKPTKISVDGAKISLLRLSATKYYRVVCKDEEEGPMGLHCTEESPLSAELS